MSILKKFNLTLIFLLVILAVVAGCTPGATPLPQPSPPQEEAVVDQATDAVVTPLPATEAAPAATETSAPTATLEPQEPVPPFVLNSSPERGQSQPLDAPIEVTFDQAMDRDSVEAAFAIEPGASVDGAFEWVDDQTVRFSLTGGFKRGERYRVRVVETAQSQTGLTMLRPFELRFDAVGFLEVATVQPAAGTEEVAVEALVTVMFNRPVVALKAIEDAGSLPDPLTFTPPLTGEGVWLNTATYQFIPSGAGFQPATTYTARVAQGLTDVFGQTLLEEDFEWDFTIISPAVVTSLPQTGDLYVSATPVISLAFNQLMNHASVEQNLLLLDEASGQPVPGEFSWAAQGIMPPPAEGVYYDPAVDPATIPELQPVGVETVAFTPDEPLAFGGSYQVLLPKGVESSLGTASKNDFSANFTVTPLPELVSTNPTNGEQFADIWQGLDLTFNAPMAPASFKLGESLVVADIAATEVYSYWSNNDTQLTLNFPRQENQTYTVTLTTDVSGRYGQPLAQAETITWKTLRASPYVYLVSPKVATYNGYRDQTYIYMTVRNVSQVNFELYRLSPRDFQNLAGSSFRGWQPGGDIWERFSPKSEDLVGTWQQPTAPETFINYVYKVDVSQAVSNGQPLPPGLYYLEAFSNPEDYYDEAQVGETGPPRDRQILIVSKTNLTLKQGNDDLLVWLTDLESGQPVAEVPLSLTDPTGKNQTGSTDADGVATFSYSQVAPEDQGKEVFVFAGDPAQPGDTFAIGSNNWSAGIDPYDFNYLFGSQGFRYSGAYSGYVYPERRLYRPGQTVYFKGMVRTNDDAQFSIPPTDRPVSVTIYDAQYRQIYTDSLTLNEWGTFNGSLVLAEEASLGSYQIEASFGQSGNYYVPSFYGSFNVAEYRKPEFLVEAETDKTDYLPGDSIELTLKADFFAGGPVKNGAVRWTLLSDASYFDYQGGGYYDFTNEDNSRADAFNPAYGFGFGEQIANGEGLTDANGRFMVEVPADLTGRLTSQTYTFDVAVTGLNNQEVATQVRATVHKGELYVGLRPTQYVGQVGTENEIEVLTVDWNSEPVVDQPVELVFAEENWYSVQQLDPSASQLSPDDQFYWQNIVESKAVFSQTVTTDREGLAVAGFSPEKSGSYKVYARAVDSGGRELFSSAFIWVSGFEFVNWGQEDHDRIELVPDLPEYHTGDTATILVPHPYSGTVTALVTIERGHIYDHFVTELTSNSAQIEVPISEAMSPNAYVSVVVMQGGASDSPPAGGIEGGLIPSFKMGYARLNVDPAEKQLNIALTTTTPPNAEGLYQPDQTVEYQVKVTDFKGEPVQAELSLALIDKAVLTLAPETPGELFDAFWHARALDVSTASGLTLALDRINRALDEKKGGGGGDGAAGLDSVRRNFADTVLWLPNLVTDANGEATAEATLPDNLTTWVMLAKGISGDDSLVGEARSEIVTSKPLLVRPVTPRFFVVGDQAQLGLVIQNNGEETLTVEPSFEATGLEIGDWRLVLSEVEGLGDGAWQDVGEATEITVEPGEEVKVEYQVVVSDAETAQLTMGATATDDSSADAVAFELPIYHFSAPETVATVGVLDEAGSRLEGIALPRVFDPSQGDLTINIEPSLAAGLRDGLTYLEHFPYECVEQTVSRFLPNIFTYRAYQTLGLDNSALARRLPDLVGVGVQRLISQQNVDGGWGWWAGSQSDPFLSAYVLLGLVEARRSDFAVDQWIIDNAVNYLDQSLVAAKDMAAPWQANRQAFTLYVLAEAGQGDLSRAVALFEQREKLDLFGRAYLALAIYLADPQAQQIDTLISDLTSVAVVSASGAHWQEAQPDLNNMNSDTRSTAIIIAALARMRPDHPLLPQAVRWLMTIREQKGYWSTTQETAWAIIGLTDWLAVTGELEADYTWQVSLNGQGLGDGVADATSLAETTSLRVTVNDLLSETVNRLAIERDPTAGAADDAGRLTYGAYLTYFKPVEQVKALDRGIIISREYLSLPSTSPLPGGIEGGPITEAAVGDFIQVKLTLIAPNDLYYVMVEDYLPAGTEAVDSSLATTSLVGQPPQVTRADQLWGSWYFNHTDLRDEKAVLFADYLPRGVYEYTYTIRASTPGEYRVIPSQAEELYFPEVFGRSDGGVFTVVGE